MRENKITSFDEWFNNHEFNHFKTGSHKERCEIAWTACAKMKNEEINRLIKENEELKKQIAKLKRNSFER